MKIKKHEELKFKSPEVSRSMAFIFAAVLVLGLILGRIIFFGFV